MLGEHVRNIRKKRGITLKELAEKTGLSIGYISQIGRNLSGYSLANALFNCISPKRTPYKALADYMKRRQESRTGIVIRDYLIKKQHR